MHNMLTKTKELILNRKQQQTTSQPLRTEHPSHPNPINSANRSPSLVSHINEHHYVPTNYRREPIPQAQSLRQLQAQNLRLIEQNMRLAEWSHLMLNKLRDGIRKAISTIQEFRYLEGVNILYSLLSEVTEYESLKVVTESSRMNLYGQDQIIRRYANPQSQGSLVLQFQKLKIQSQMNLKILPTKNMESENMQEGSFPSFMRSKGHKVDESEQVLWRMLLVQSQTLDSLQDWFPRIK